MWTDSEVFFKKSFSSLSIALWNINPFISCFKGVLITYLHLWNKWTLNEGESSFTLLYIKWINDLFKKKVKNISILKIPTHS